MGSPGSQSAPQLQIEVQTQLFGVVVSGSATSFDSMFSTFSVNSCSAFCREKGHDAMNKDINMLVLIICKFSCVYLSYIGYILNNLYLENKP